MFDRNLQTARNNSFFLFGARDMGVDPKTVIS